MPSLTRVRSAGSKACQLPSRALHAYCLQNAAPRTLQNLCVEAANAPPQPGAAVDPTPGADLLASARRAAVAALRAAACEGAALLEDAQLAEEEHVTRLGFATKVRGGSTASASGGAWRHACLHGSTHAACSSRAGARRLRSYPG